MSAQTPERKSIWQRMAEKKEDVHPLVDVDFDFSAETTSTFRVEHTGELILDTAGTLAGSLDAQQSLGELDAATAAAYHLFALPPDRSGAEVEALAISVWNEAGWINPGVLHLTEGVTLEGPWEVSGETRAELGLREDEGSVWLLRCQPTRGAAPTSEIRSRDELARAFPEGMPVGVELAALSVLRRMARRLGGQLRAAGSGHLFEPSPDSAVNLRVYTADPLSPADLHRILEDLFSQVTKVSSPPAENPDQPHPHAALVELEEGGKVLVGMRPVDEIPRVLRWEGWVRGQVFMYEVTWADALELTLPGGQLTRVGRRVRDSAATAIGLVAGAISAETRNVAIVDEDDFLVLPEELLVEEGQDASDIPLPPEVS